MNGLLNFEEINGSIKSHNMYRFIIQVYTVRKESVHFGRCGTYIMEPISFHLQFKILEHCDKVCHNRIVYKRMYFK